MSTSHLWDYFPIVIMALIALGFVVTVMVLTHSVGPKRHVKIKEEAFECGIESKGNARTPFSIKYFLVAILFVLFDVEVIFFYPYAVNFRALGWEGFIAVILFVASFLAGFIYIFKKGALKWEE